MRKTILFATMALVASTAPAAAQTFGFGAHAGVSLPTSDYGDVAETGFLGGLDLVYPLYGLAPGLGWYSSVDAIAHSWDNIDNGALYVPIMTGLRFTIPAGPIALFATGQLGAILTRGPSNDEGLDPELGTEFGFNFGGGLHLTENVYAGVKYYPLGDVDFGYDGTDDVLTADVSFLDIYVGFGVF